MEKVVKQTGKEIKVASEKPINFKKKEKKVDHTEDEKDQLRYLDFILEKAEKWYYKQFIDFYSSLGSSFEEEASFFVIQKAWALHLALVSLASSSLASSSLASSSLESFSLTSFS